MRKLIVSEFLSLDGVIQAPGGADAGDLRHTPFFSFESRRETAHHFRAFDFGPLPKSPSTNPASPTRIAPPL